MKAEQKVQSLTDQTIKIFLETAPLYTWEEFDMSTLKRQDLWIRQIDSFCEFCGREKIFEDRSTSRASWGGLLRVGQSKAPPPPGIPLPVLETGVSSLNFDCVTCGKEDRIFYLEHTVQGSKVKIQKYGQLPRMKLFRNKLLQDFMGDDQDIYDKAVTCAAEGYGIGSFAYFRVVLERNIVRLIELLEEEARITGVSPKIIKALANLKKGTPMKSKIEVANHALPNSLNPNGLNPLGRLYGVLSEGVHGHSEPECLAKAKDIEKWLGYLITELATHKKNRSQYQIDFPKL